MLRRVFADRARLFRSLAVLILLSISTISGLAQTPSAQKKSSSTAGATVAEASAFVARAEKRLLDLWIKQSRADWVA